MPEWLWRGLVGKGLSDEGVAEAIGYEVFDIAEFNNVGGLNVGGLIGYLLVVARSWLL